MRGKGACHRCTNTLVHLFEAVNPAIPQRKRAMNRMKEPGMMESNLEPRGAMKFANHLFKTRTQKWGTQT